MGRNLSNISLVFMENFRQQNFILRLPDLSSYCGLVDTKIRASDKDLPVLTGLKVKGAKAIAESES